MKKTTKSRKRTKPAPAKKPAPPVKITLHVFPHVVQTLVDGVEAPKARRMQPVDVEALKAEHEKHGRVVTVEKFNTAGQPVE